LQKVASPNLNIPVRCLGRVTVARYPISEPSEGSRENKSRRRLSLTALLLHTIFSLLAELELGRVLGRGGFCVVNEITKIALQTATTTKAAAGKSDGADPQEQNGNFALDLNYMDDENAIHNVVQDRAFMEDHCLRGKGRDCRYALKQLQESSWENAHTFVNGVVDLAVEARFLAVIRHPNIIKMRAMATTSPYSPHAPFFVVLDRLYDIMGMRIVKWKKRKPAGMVKLLDRKRKKEQAFWVERISVAYDLACALQYLHSLK
jgi:hypothetical protein